MHIAFNCHQIEILLFELHEVGPNGQFLTKFNSFSYLKIPVFLQFKVDLFRQKHLKLKFDLQKMRNFPAHVLHTIGIAIKRAFQ